MPDHRMRNYAGPGLPPREPAPAPIDLGGVLHPGDQITSKSFNRFVEHTLEVAKEEAKKSSSSLLEVGIDVLSRRLKDAEERNHQLEQLVQEKDRLIVEKDQQIQRLLALQVGSR